MFMTKIINCRLVNVILTNKSSIDGDVDVD